MGEGEGGRRGRERERERREAGSVAGANQIPGRVTGDPMMPRPSVEVVAEYRRSPVTVKDSVTSASPVVKEFRSKSHCCVFAIHRGTWRANDPCPILPRMDILAIALRTCTTGDARCALLGEKRGKGERREGEGGSEKERERGGGE